MANFPEGFQNTNLCAHCLSSFHITAKFYFMEEKFDVCALMPSPTIGEWDLNPEPMNLKFKFFLL